MRKFYTFLSVLLLSLSVVLVSSCEPYEDMDTAAVLDGTWQGSLGQEYYGIYGPGYEEWETEFRFNAFSSTATNGYGVEIDYDPNYWSNYKYYDFRWEVAMGNIYLHYANGDELIIRQYRLTDRRLSGVLETYDGRYVANLTLMRTGYWPWGNGISRSSSVLNGKSRGFGQDSLSVKQ